MAWLKALHIAALLVWAASLLYLPMLLAAHRRVDDNEDFIRARRASRFNYTVFASPGGFIAVASGATLLFVADVFQAWMFLKLAFVGVLVCAHMYYGHVLGRLAAPDEEPPRRLLAASAGAVGLAASVILWLVLEKPAVPATDLLPAWMTEPGGLQSFVSEIMPI